MWRKIPSRNRKIKALNYRFSVIFLTLSCQHSTETFVKLYNDWHFNPKSHGKKYWILRLSIFSDTAMIPCPKGPGEEIHVCCIYYLSKQGRVIPVVWGAPTKDESQLCLQLTHLPTGQNGRHFADNMFKRIFLNENIWMSNEISLKYVPWDVIDRMPALVQIMAWRRPGDKPLSEPMLTQFTDANMRHYSWADNCICQKNRSNYDTSNKFGTNTLLGSLFKKKTRATQNFNMAAIFQFGRHGLSWNPIVCFKGAADGWEGQLW